MINSVFVSAIAGVALTTATVLTSTAAQAALLKFNFTTDQGGSGSFVLNTETPLSLAIPPQLDANGNVVALPVNVYANAVSSFSFSSPGAGSFQYDPIDFALLVSSPSLNSSLGLIGSPACGDFSQDCPLQLEMIYRGAVANLPSLSIDPSNYFLFSVVAFKAFALEATFVEKITSTTATVIPTPALLPGLIGFSAAVIRKRRAAAKERVLN